MLTPTKNKILEEQALWHGTNCYANISYEIEYIQQFARFNITLIL